MKSKLNRCSIMYLSMISDEVAYDETWPLTVYVDVCMSEEEEGEEKKQTRRMHIHEYTYMRSNR
jgi:hypothetical protein